MTSPGGNGSSSSQRVEAVRAPHRHRGGPRGDRRRRGPVGRDSGTADQTATSDTAGTSANGDPASTVATPMTYADAEAAGTADQTTWVDNCDPETGRITIPSVYAPPCVPAFSGDNGGATSPGVTADSIKVVSYTPPANADITSALGGAADEPDQILQTRKDFVAMLQDVSETYGRTVELVEFQGTGPGDDAVAAQADAVNIVENMKPFAVLNGRRRRRSSRRRWPATRSSASRRPGAAGLVHPGARALHLGHRSRAPSSS